MEEPYTLTINLTNQQIDASLKKIEAGLTKYITIHVRLNELAGKPLGTDEKFRKSFNGFYRIRQKPAAWYNVFYQLLDESRGQAVDFPVILRSLYEQTGRYEASFASKLLATLNPHMPVIDSVVLKNLQTRLPYASAPNRFENICSLHTAIGQCYSDYLQSDQGRYLVSQFRELYPNTDITKVKMLDLVLWQVR